MLARAVGDFVYELTRYRPDGALCLAFACQVLGQAAAAGKPVHLAVEMP